MQGISSRAKGTCLGRRSCTPTKGLGSKIGHCENNEVELVGKPDKTAAWSPTRSQCCTITSLRGDIEPKLQFARRWQSALATGLLSRRKNRFVARQVLSLCADADCLCLGDWRPLGSAGGTTGFLATPLLLCTATSRGKDDPYRGVFSPPGGEICFSRSEFWTGGNEKENGPRSNCRPNASRM